MATVVSFLLCYRLVLGILPSTEASTHWMVTEDGRIQTQMDSIYNLRRPYDLMAMMKQEQQSEKLKLLKQELLVKKQQIDRNEDRDTGLEDRFYREDPDCIAAGKPLLEFDLLISTVLPLENKGIRPEEHIDFNSKVPDLPREPECSDMVDLDYSIHAFEHLEGLKARSNLSGSPELGLKNAITHRDSVEDYGHLVHEAMHKNKTSWVLYNMAAFYWRIKGQPTKAVECLRRALHYSPRLHKDVALISLANLLHRARYSNEAAIIVHAALDVSQELNVNHFTLGNIYAVLAEYNKSIICFENTLKIQPDFQAAAKRKHAVKCHAKLEASLEAQHRSLQRTLTELREYQESHEFFRLQQERLMLEQASVETRLEQNKAYESLQQKRIEAGLSEICQLEELEGNSVLHCSWVASNPILRDEEFLASWDSGNKGAKPEPNLTSINYVNPIRPPRFTRRMSSSGQVNRHPSPHQELDWPLREECETQVQKFPAWNEFPTNYLAPENKGFEVRALLTEAQGLSLGMQHSFPWYPPVCIDLTPKIPEGSGAYDHIQTVNERSKVPSKIPDLAVKDILIHLVDNPRDERVEITEEGKPRTQVTLDEIGQRILTGLKRNIGPSWVLYNLAALYWRIQGNHHQGLECIRRALFFCPDEYKDVPLLNLANILYKLGRVDDAITVTNDALIVNDLEPETHFFLGNLLASKVNLTGAIHHYHEALAQYPQHKAAVNSLRIVKCYLKFQHSAQSMVPPPKVEENNCKPSQCQRTVVEAKPCREPPKEDAGCPLPDDALYQMHCNTPPTVETTECDECKKIDECGVNLGQCLRSHIAARSPSDTFDPAFELATRLEMGEFLRQKALCSGEECHQVLLQNHRLHTQLEIVNGVLHQKLIFMDAATDFVLTPTDCIIYNDGQKSAGCGRDEFKPYNIEELTSSLMFAPTSATKNAPIEPEEALVSTDFILSDLDIVMKAPDTLRHVTKSSGIAPPTLEDCKKDYQHVNFQMFMSTWVSVTAKGVDVSDYIDFDSSSPAHMSEPHCVASEKRTALDLLPSVQDPAASTAKYTPEIGLKDALQKLGGDGSVLAIAVAGTRISDALKRNETSWVLANLAALYWRVEGEATKAIQCLKLAYLHSPLDARDVALLAMANVLFKSKQVDDAIIVTDLALEAAPHLVALHFTMANLHAAKSDWDRAIKFYDSTLGIQGSFPPAQLRLRSLRCEQALPVENNP